MDEKNSEKKTNRGRKGDLFLLPSLSTSRLVRRRDSEPRSDSSIDESMPRNLAKGKETMATHLIQEGVRTALHEATKDYEALRRPAIERYSSDSSGGHRRGLRGTQATGNCDALR
ncbi:unnamed protein product [Ilex paraguariensis]|uniref:Uncharacterized protein n=1 Tax=Ilex paraguariensis TaxID=185542 RepID=A0ABC8RNE6_9AQUA